MHNLAIIPARCGSKGLKNKNILELNQKPLMAYSIEAALNSKQFDEVMVSTDSEEYAEIAKRYGANVPFIRSKENSNDMAGSWAVAKEVIRKYLEKGIEFDSFCLLQPTSPLRSEEDIVAAYKLYNELKADAVTSVCEVDHPPIWNMTLDDSLSMKEFRKKLVAAPRQAFEKYYRLNGAIYIRKIEYLEGDLVEFKEEKEYAYCMPRKRSVDIDTIDDFELAEFYINKSL